MSRLSPGSIPEEREARERRIIRTGRVGTVISFTLTKRGASVPKRGGTASRTARPRHSERVKEFLDE